MNRSVVPEPVRTETGSWFRSVERNHRTRPVRPLADSTTTERTVEQALASWRQLPCERDDMPLSRAGRGL